MVGQIVAKSHQFAGGATEEDTTRGWRDRAFLVAYQLALIEPMPE